jgi:hypothetical protein
MLFAHAQGQKEVGKTLISRLIVGRRSALQQTPARRTRSSSSKIREIEMQCNKARKSLLFNMLLSNFNILRGRSCEYHGKPQTVENRWEKLSIQRGAVENEG